MKRLLASSLACGILLLLVVGAAARLQAQQGVWRSRTLVNGMTVTYQQDSTRQLLHMALTLRGGGSLDGPDAQGLAKLYEHLFFQSNPDSSAATARQAGIYLSHKTLLESHFFGISLPPTQLAPALLLLESGLTATAWSDSTLQVARAEIVPALQNLENAPSYHLAAELRESLWLAFASRKQTAGRYADILRLGSAEIIAEIAPYRHPANCLLTATGPDDGQAFFAAVEARLGRWQPGGAGALLPVIEAPQLKESIYFQTINEFAAQPIIMIAWPIPTTAQPATLHQDAAHFCTLAQLKLGRMYQQLVDSGLALDYTWRWEGGLNPGQIVLEVIPDKERFGKCMAVLHQEIARLGEADRYGKEEITAASRLTQLQAAKTDDQSIPRLLASGQAWTLAQGDENAAAPISAERMRAFATAHLVAQPHVAGLLLNSTAAVAMEADAVFQESTGLIAAVEDTTMEGGSTLHTIDPAQLRTLRIYYQEDKLTPDSAAVQTLEAIAAMLKDHPEKRIYLNSFAEGLGDGVKNYQLSVTRAKSLRTQLMQDLGVNPKQLVIRAYGEAFPEFANENDLRNRRLSFEYAPANAQDNVF